MKPLNGDPPTSASDQEIVAGAGAAGLAAVQPPLIVGSQVITVSAALAAVELSASAAPARITRIAPRITISLVQRPIRAAVNSRLTHVCCGLLTVFFLADSRHSTATLKTKGKFHNWR